MAAAPELGELLDIAKAVGLVNADGSLNPAWFGDPGKFTGQISTSSSPAERPPAPGTPAAPRSCARTGSRSSSR